MAYFKIISKRDNLVETVKRTTSFFNENIKWQESGQNHPLILVNY
jgi:hypothetical protein